LICAAPAGAATKPLWLETHDVRKNTSTKVVGPVKSRSLLATGKPYVATVKGTWSYYEVKAYRTCGKPERRPTYRSPSVDNGRVGSDAEFFFADRSAQCRLRGGRALAPGIQFRISLGGAYQRILPLGPALTRPTKGHIYRYPLRGAGKRAGFQLLDNKPKDNYGRLRILVRAAKAHECAANGFTAFKFMTEGECVLATQLRG